MAADQLTSNVKAILDAMFGPGDHFSCRPRLRGVRLKVAPTGHLTLAHPRADGPRILKVQQVPCNVSDAEVLRRMGSVAVLRPDRTVHYSEIKTGAIVR